MEVIKFRFRRWAGDFFGNRPTTHQMQVWDGGTWVVAKEWKLCSWCRLWSVTVEPKWAQWDDWGDGPFLDIIYFDEGDVWGSREPPADDFIGNICSRECGLAEDDAVDRVHERQIAEMEGY